MGDPSGDFDANGSVFKVTTNGALTTLVKFDGINGRFPRRLVQGTEGNLYGVTAQGGQYGNSTAFQLTPDGAFRTLASFAGTNGTAPFCGLIQASDGAFYGVTQNGGAYGKGVVFRLGVPGADAPRIQASATGAGRASLSWVALVGRSYQLQFKTNASQTNWQNSGASFKATNAITTVVDSAGSAPKRFYRLVLLP
jgi:uncharacterized repeat protein (TIGR03803 family)